MELTTVLFDVADRVATITLNRPDGGTPPRSRWSRS